MSDNTADQQEDDHQTVIRFMEERVAPLLGEVFNGFVIAGIGVVGALGPYAITHAFRHGEASLLAPLEYTALVWGVLLDATVWGVLPDSVTWIGAGIIIASGIYLIRREGARVPAEPIAPP